MKKLFVIAAVLAGLGAGQPPALDYGQLIHLDAEDLAEGGIQEAYAKVLPAFRKYVKKPATVEEILDPQTPAYAVISGSVRYEIYGPAIPPGQSWGNATFALFSIVNRQLGGSGHGFYAINGGNDLGGMFLTDRQVKAAMATLKKKTDWPYVPTADPPWHGQHH